MPEKYINPFTDFGFKKLFGEEANKDLLLDFIETLFEEIAKYNPKERQNYENSLKHYRDMENSLDLKYEKGKKEGLKKGKAQGLKEGLKEGLREGLLTTARNMKADGFTIEQIVKVTGLTEAEILKS